GGNWCIRTRRWARGQCSKGKTPNPALLEPAATDRALLGDDDIDGFVVVLDRYRVNHLYVEADPHAGDRTGCSKEHVVEAASVPKAVALFVERDAGDDHYAGRVGRDRQARARLGDAAVAGLELVQGRDRGRAQRAVVGDVR